MKFRIWSVPMLCRPEAHSTGKDAHFADAAACSPSTMCSTGSVPFSKNSSMQASLPSATISTSASCALLRGIGQVGGDLAFFALAVAIRRVGVGLHADQVDHAFEIALRCRSEAGSARPTRPKISCTLSRARLKSERSRSSLLMMMARGSLKSFGETPDLLGLDFDAGHAVHQDQRGIGGDQRAARVIDKDVVARECRGY